MVGGIIGIATPFVRRTIYVIWPSLPVVVEGPVLLLGYFLALASIGRPGDSYRFTLKLALAATIGVAFHATLALLFIDRVEWGAYWWIPIVGIPLAFALTFLITSLVLCGSTYIRRRISPPIPPGHCTRCGYCLFGLPTNICPECGTPFCAPDETTRPSGLREAT